METFEAEALTAKATELMAKYGIDKALAEANDSGTTGKELVLASRDVAVTSARDAFYPTLTKVTTSYSGRSAGAGIAAGQRANIHSRPNVGGSGRALSR